MAQSSPHTSTSKNGVIASRDQYRFAPILVLGPARSYSSVVTSMLGQHPELYGLPELKLFAYPTLAELDASLPSYAKRKGIAHRSPGLVRTVAELHFGGQVQETELAALAWLAERAAWSGTTMFDVIQDWVAPWTAVQKSPDDVQSAATLSRLSGAYPRASYIHLTRHPSTSILSMYDHWTRMVPGGPPPGLVQTCIDTYVQTHRRILEFESSKGADRVLQVKAEDVLNRPDDSLRAILRWLSLDDSQKAVDAMKHPERSPFAQPLPIAGGFTGGGDASFLEDPVPHAVIVPTGLEPPMGWFNDDNWADVKEIATCLGY